MSMNTQGRPTTPGAAARSTTDTFSGHRGLDHEEPLVFERGRIDTTGVDLPEPIAHPARLGTLARKTDIGLPGLSEPETMRHYVRLSRKNYAIDSGLYPLGSCTMKHNARLNEKLARLPGFSDVHPLQPTQTVQGALELMQRLGYYLCELTGMPAVALSPKAGAHGELCGMLAIKAAHDARHEKEGGQNAASCSCRIRHTEPTPRRPPSWATLSAPFRQKLTAPSQQPTSKQPLGPTSPRSC